MRRGQISEKFSSEKFSSEKFSVAVAGASGYAGGELLRLIFEHPNLSLEKACAHSSAGVLLSQVHPHLHSEQAGKHRLSHTSAEALGGYDLVFIALPHGVSAPLTAGLEALGNRSPRVIVDCGADHRLESPEAWKRYYGGDYSPPWAYGLPELPLPGAFQAHSPGNSLGGNIRRQRQLLQGTGRIAAPGCNASAVTLALAPGFTLGLLEAEDLVATLCVGPSGAGKVLKPELSASEIMGSATPYAVGGIHRHIPEIQQNLRRCQPAETHSPEHTLTFTPVLVPFARGILATVSARIRPDIRERLQKLDAEKKDDLPQALRRLWQRVYAHEPFITVLPEGQLPRVSDVVGSNRVALGLTVDIVSGRLTVLCALDNLLKGTAGAALQSANLALGLPETLGLPLSGLAP